MALPGIEPHELIFVGDRIFTDGVLAHRLAHPRTLTQHASLRVFRLESGSSLVGAGARPGASVWEGGEPTRVPLGVWTTGMRMRESMTMRWTEKWLVHPVERCVQGARECRDAGLLGAC